MERAHHARFGLKLHEARFLYQALAGRLRRGWDSKASAAERQAMASLLKAGLVEMAGDELRLTEAVRFILLP